MAGRVESSFSAASKGNSVSMGLSSLAGSVGRTRKPGVSVTKISLSACKAVATEVATSSIVKLNASPVGEKPKGDSKTTGEPGLEGILKRATGFKGKALKELVESVIAGCTTEGTTKLVPVVREEYKKLTQ